MLWNVETREKSNLQGCATYVFLQTKTRVALYENSNRISVRSVLFRTILHAWRCLELCENKTSKAWPDALFLKHKTLLAFKYKKVQRFFFWQNL